MIYKLKLLNSKKEEIAEYHGKQVVTEEILDNCFIVRMPFDFTEHDMKSDPDSPFVRSMSDFIHQLSEAGALEGKNIFVVPRQVEFMKLEEE